MADVGNGNNAAKIKYHIVRYTRGTVLDIGAGPFKAFPHFLSVDNRSELAEYNWSPDINCDASRLDIIASNSVDAVFSSHLLHLLEDQVSALGEWWRTIKIGGYLVLYLPYIDRAKRECIPKDIISIFKNNAGDWDLIESETRLDEGDKCFLQVYKKLPKNSGQQYSFMAPRFDKTCLVIRYGGFGDMIMSASILPGLKRQGYHITFNTTPSGHNIIKHDPNIDDWIIQDYHQVPNTELPDYWDALAEKYDKVVNLSESVEGTFLAVAGRPNHRWPLPVRQKMMGMNYYEFGYMLAGLNFGESRPPEHPPFYETDRERRIAERRRDEIDGICVLWCLSGSSLHKAWPYIDAVIAEFMLDTEDVNFVLCGDDACRVLEQGWEQEPRVHLRSGEWSIRETLSFAKTVDLVIGPQTGVIASLAGTDLPKLIFMSHSSEENLTKYWRNCIALKPDKKRCPCYPCHLLHSNFEFCQIDNKTGAALCQASIEPPEVVQAIKTLLNTTHKKMVA